MLGKMELTATDEYAKRSVQHVEKSMPHLSVDKIKEILDPTGFNVTFSTTDKMKEAAGKLLADADKVRFTGTSAQQCAFIDFIKAVRNFLAHRSQSADNTMQAALAAVDLPVELRRGNNNVNDVGSWLRATPAQGNPQRFLRVLVHVRALAAHLCP
jgi:hypothetical protein